MLVLGIECTAHTFGVGVIETKTKDIICNEKSVFKDEHQGMDPRKLSEFHIAHFQEVLLRVKNILKDNHLDFKDIELISFSQGPGQGNSLKVAGLVAKTLALEYSIEIIGVNHIISHLEIGKMHTGFKDPVFLNITGVNSQVVAKDVSEVYRVYGETEDIGLGNLFDSVARLFDLGFPGGPVIEKRAARITENFDHTTLHFIDIPYTIKGMDVSFAGLYSNIAQKKQSFENQKPIPLLDGSKKVYDSLEDFIDDICFSLQETVFAMIQEVAERALAYTSKKELVLVGGVAANKRFVEMTTQMCFLRNVVYDALPLPLCMDNGVMIAWCGFVKKIEGRGSNKGDISGLHPLPYITVESNP